MGTGFWNKLYHVWFGAIGVGSALSLTFSAYGGEKCDLSFNYAKEESKIFPEKNKSNYLIYDISSDSSKLAYATDRNTLKILDLKKGSEKKIICDSSLNKVNFSPNGKLIITSSQSSTDYLTVHNLENGEKFDIKNDNMSAGAFLTSFSEDGKKAIVEAGYGSDSEWVVDLATGQKKEIPENLFDSSPIIDFSKNLTIVAGAKFKSNTINILNLINNTRQTITHHNKVIKVIISPDEKKVIGTFEDGMVKILNLESGKEYGFLQKSRPSWKYDFTKNSDKVVLTFEDQTVKIFDLSEKSTKIIFDKKYNGKNSFFFFSPDGSRLISLVDHTVEVTNLKTGTIKKIQHKKDISYVSYSNDGLLLASSSQDGTMKLLNLENGKEETIPFKNGDYIGKFSEDKTKIIREFKGGSIKILDLKSKKESTIAGPIEVPHPNLTYPNYVKFLDQENKVLLVRGDTISIKSLISKKNLLQSDFSNDEMKKLLLLKALDPRCPKDVPSFVLSRGPSDVKGAYLFAKNVLNKEKITPESFDELPEMSEVFLATMIEKHKERYEYLSSQSGYNANHPEDPSKSIAFDQQKYLFNKKQLLSILSVYGKEKDLSEKNLEQMVWVLSHSKDPLDASLLENLNLDSEKLKKDILDLLKTEPYKYKGSLSLAAIKFAKAMLGTKEEAIQCSSEKSENEFGKILIQFNQYGDLLGADRLFYAKLARAVLEKQKKICPEDRNQLLRALTSWRNRSNAPVQYELGCALSAQNDFQPFDLKKMNDFLTLSAAVGTQSNLSTSGFFEQLKFFGKTASGNFDDAVESETFYGLMKHVAGMPKGVRTAMSPEFHSAEATANPGSIVKLCQLQKRENTEASYTTFFTGASVFLQLLKEKLDEKDIYPKDFKPDSQESLTLRERLMQAGMEKDIQAIESSCESVKLDPRYEVHEEKEVKEKSKPMKAKPRKKHRGSGFDPRGR